MVSALLLLAFVALLACGWLAPLVGDRWLRPLERKAGHFARQKALTIVSLGLATIVARLALLPVLPVPEPAVHDEFSYLLSADTFAHGRLTNPPHRMWRFFDTFHVLQHPTYSSKYPPAAGAAMAVGQLLGHPWIGVLLTMAAMTMAMTWMLQGWFPPPWALLGGVLVILQFVLFKYWCDSYYNGSVATVGAALVLGAFPRMVKLRRARDSALMGLGAVILAASRTVEGLIFCVPLAIALAIALRKQAYLKNVWSHTLLPFLVVLTLGMLFLALYNARVTGSPLEFPYALYHRQYFNYPFFAWQKAGPPLHYDNPQFEVFFNLWQQSHYALTWQGWKQRTATAFWLWWIIFLGPLLTIPFVMLPRLMRDRRMRLPLSQFAVCALGLVSIVWFQPHYAAPLAATLFVLLVQAMRHLRRVVIAARPVGIFLTRLIVVLVFDWILISAGQAARHQSAGWNVIRAQMIKTLESQPGNHLVLVHYAPNHGVHHEWVYNRADIDHTRVVWAREIPGQDLGPLLEYFNGRKIWEVQPDRSPPTLAPYKLEMPPAGDR